MINFEQTALILIDLQEGLIHMDSAPYDTKSVIQNANRLIQLFRENNGFIAFVHVDFYDGQDEPKNNAMISLPKAENVQFAAFATGLNKKADDYVVTKRGFSAFFGTDLDLQLRRRGIDTVVMGGISTHMGVDTTARDAFQRGYNQYLISDMMTAPKKELHDFSVRAIFPVIGQVMTTDEFMK